MSALELIKLIPLMELTSGQSQVKIGLIDGPIFAEHVHLSHKSISEIPNDGGTCARPNSPACLHGTFIAGILSAKRDSPAPGICPDCTLLLRPIFSEISSEVENMPTATPIELAAAINDCINEGARLINLSLALLQSSSRPEQALEEALNAAGRRGVIVVAAAGNQSSLGSSAITRHPCVIPVVACDLSGRAMGDSNLGSSIGRRGLRAPGDNITSLGSGGQSAVLSGTSVAVPFVTGVMALLWSAFPEATAADIRFSIMGSTALRRSVMPPLLNATDAWHVMQSLIPRTRIA